MKKIYVIMALLLCFSFLFASCADAVFDTTNTDPAAVCEFLTQKATVKKENISVKITTTTSNIELTASYEIKGNDVTYLVERANQISLDGENNDSAKTTLTGTAVIDDKTITKLDGADVAMPDYEMLQGKFIFDHTNMQNIVVANNTLSANIIVANDFFGKTVSVKNVSFSVLYTGKTIASMTLNYATNDSIVKVEYQFS